MIFRSLRNSDHHRNVCHFDYIYCQRKKANFSPMNCYFGVCQWFIDIVSSTNEWLAIFSKYFAIIVNDVEKKSRFFLHFHGYSVSLTQFFSIAIVFVAKVNQKLRTKSLQEAEKSAQYIDHYFHKFSLNTLWKLYNYCETFEHNNRRHRGQKCGSGRAREMGNSLSVSKSFLGQKRKILL